MQYRHFQEKYQVFQENNKEIIFLILSKGYQQFYSEIIKVTLNYLSFRLRWLHFINRQISKRMEVDWEMKSLYQLDVCKMVTVLLELNFLREALFFPLYHGITNVQNTLDIFWFFVGWLSLTVCGTFFEILSLAANLHF